MQILNHFKLCFQFILAEDSNGQTFLLGKNEKFVTNLRNLSKENVLGARNLTIKIIYFKSK